MIINWNDTDRALWSAAGLGDMPTVRKLLADRSVSDNAIEESLRLAGMYGHAEIIQMLLDTGRVSDDGEIDNAIWWATEHGYIEVANILNTYKGKQS
jgi:ankyrin repeat protein